MTTYYLFALCQFKNSTPIRKMLHKKQNKKLQIVVVKGYKKEATPVQKEEI